MKQKTGRISRYVFPAAIWIGLVLLGLEIILRTGVHSPGVKFAFDPDWGKRPAAGSVVVWGTEGYGVTHFSADGEIATPFTGGAQVVVLGDSHTEGFQVNDAEKYPAVAESRLRALGIEADLLNLGFSGATLADYVYLAPLIRARYQPKVIVIQISQTDFGPEGFDSSRTNYFTISEDGALTLCHTPPADTPVTVATNLKRTLALIEYGYVRLGKIMAHLPQPSAAQPAAHNASARVLSDQRSIWTVELGALQLAYAGAPVMVVVLPYVPAIKGGELVSVDADYEALVQMVRSMSDWRVVDPLTGFQALADQQQLPRGFTNTIPGTGHLNAAGHQVIGTLLAEQIAELWR